MAPTSTHLHASGCPGTTHFATLPRGLRPTRDMVLTDFTEAGAPGAIEVLTNGQMAAFGTTARSFTSLAGISFPFTWQASRSPRMGAMFVFGGDATGFSWPRDGSRTRRTSAENRLARTRV